MMKPGKRFFLLTGILLLVVMLTSLLAGCGKQEPGTAPQVRESTLVIAPKYEDDNLNPILGYGKYGGSKFFNGLVKFDEDLNVVPDLAESWEVSSDGKTYTFHLRRAVKWHDGKEFTADDVKFTYEKILDPEVASPLKPYFELVEKIDVVDDYTLRIQLSKPYAPFLEKLVVGIVPKHLLDGKDIKTAEFNHNPVGTGPFKFVEWKKGERLVMEANPDYFLGKPEVDRVVVTFIPDENTRLLQIVKGEVDGAFLPPKLASKAESSEVQVFTVPTGEWCGIALPYENPLFRDRNLRQAIAYAIDKQAIVDNVLEGKGEPTSIPFRSNHWAFNPKAKRYSPDLEKAKTLLAASGWEDTDGDGILDKNGEPLCFTLMYPADDVLRKDICTAVRTDLREVGIDVELAGLSWEQIKPRMYQDATLFFFATVYDPDDQYPIWHSEFIGQGWWNPTCFRNGTVDELLEKGRATMDKQKRREIYGKLQEILAEEQPMVFIAFMDHTYLCSKRIKGIKIQPEGHSGYLTEGIWWNLEEWSLE
jgi:peptide/nickel transport system substrate-binding protein